MTILKSAEFATVFATVESNQTPVEFNFTLSSAQADLLVQILHSTAIDSLAKTEYLDANSPLYTWYVEESKQIGQLRDKIIVGSTINKS